MSLHQNLISVKRERFLWRIAYLLIALSFVFLGNDNTFRQLLEIPSFYTDVIFSIAVTFAIGSYLDKLNAKLDFKYPWYEEFKTRLFKQFTYGVLLPLILAMVIELIYLKAINIPVRESSVLNLELPLAFIFLILINITSLTSHLFKNRQKEMIPLKEQLVVNPPKSLEYITIYKGFVEERLSLDRCALIMSSDKLLWLHTFDGEKYRLPGTLEEWEEKLKQSRFYRINRQYLSSFNAIKSVEQTPTRKLKVNFIFPTEDVYISKPNVSRFRQWWKP